MTVRRTTPEPRINPATAVTVKAHLDTMSHKTRAAFYAYVELRAVQEMAKYFTGRHDVGMDIYIVQATVDAYLEARP